MYESFDQKFKSIDKLKKWQEKTLLEFVNYALSNCRFYIDRNYPKQIKSLSEFEKLPFFTSAELKEFNMDFLTNTNDVWRVFATTGTTGKPKLSFYGKDVLVSYVIGIGDMLNRAGVELKKDSIGCVMFPMSGLTGAGPATASGLENLQIPALTLGIDFDHRIGLDIMEKFKPNFIFMYPSTFSTFTDNAEKFGYNLKEFNIKTIFSSGEPLSETMRVYIGNKWGAEIFNIIGSVDIANFTGSECKYHNGFHIFPYNAYFEIINDKGKSINEGEGELILTSLINKTMPLVRYKTGDIFSYSEKICECGLITPRIQFKARKDDILFLAGAQKLNPNDIIKALNNFSGLTSNYQIEIKKIGDKEQLTFTFESENLSKDFAEKIKLGISEFPIIDEMVNIDKVALEPQVKLVPINTLERQRGKIKNRIIDLRNK